MRYRTGRPTIKRPLYVLNYSEIPPEIRRGRRQGKLTLMAELAGISPDTVYAWIHGRSHQNDRQGAATRAKAEAFANICRVPFEQLFREQHDDTHSDIYRHFGPLPGAGR